MIVPMNLARHQRYLLSSYSRPIAKFKVVCFYSMIKTSLWLAMAFALLYPSPPPPPSKQRRKQRSNGKRNTISFF